MGGRSRLSRLSLRERLRLGLCLLPRLSLSRYLPGGSLSRYLPDGSLSRLVLLVLGVPDLRGRPGLRDRRVLSLIELDKLAGT